MVGNEIIYGHPPTIFLGYDDSIENYIDEGNKFNDSIIIYRKQLSSKGKKKMSTLNPSEDLKSMQGWQNGYASDF